LWTIPLPPYIKEKLENSERYQTVYNEIEWSVAAPTAWLHFTDELIEKLEKKWVIFEKVLLHVGLGTFKWVQTEDILDHKMHSEYIELKKDVAERLNKYKAEWKKITAVWTTSIRVLESFTNDNWIIESWNKNTDIFIYPGYKWKFVDKIITNFHLPKSTLLMLVSSFAGSENIKKAYNFAIKNKFRFFSFWDAMFIKSKK
jgi:S-adenosylmethionine:tRNA ribosyltransferase-isomerase